MVVVSQRAEVAELLAAGNILTRLGRLVLHFSDVGVVLLKDCDDRLVGPSEHDPGELSGEVFGSELDEQMDDAVHYLNGLLVAAVGVGDAAAQGRTHHPLELGDECGRVR